MGTATDLPISFDQMDPDIARRLRAIDKRLSELDAERANLILQARHDGASLREIAEVAGMSHVGIKKLIARHLHPRAYEEIDRDEIE
jgi:DNA-directed RNA polymerase specialized sigma24 family protein